MNDAAASYFVAIKARRLLGLIRGEFWAQEEDEFDLVLAAVLARLA